MTFCFCTALCGFILFDDLLYDLLVVALAYFNPAAPTGYS